MCEYVDVFQGWITSICLYIYITSTYVIVLHTVADPVMELGMVEITKPKGVKINYNYRYQCE